MFGIVPRQIVGCWNEVFVDVQHFLIDLVGLFRLVLLIVESSNHHICGNRVGIFLYDLSILVQRCIESFLRRVSIADQIISREKFWILTNRLLKIFDRLTVITRRKTNLTEQLIDASRIRALLESLLDARESDLGIPLRDMYVSDSAEYLH